MQPSTLVTLLLIVSSIVCTPCQDIRDNRTNINILDSITDSEQAVYQLPPGLENTKNLQIKTLKGNLFLVYSTQLKAQGRQAITSVPSMYLLKCEKKLALCTILGNSSKLEGKNLAKPKEKKHKNFILNADFSVQIYEKGTTTCLLFAFDFINNLANENEKNEKKQLVKLVCTNSAESLVKSSRGTRLIISDLTITKKDVNSEENNFSLEKSKNIFSHFSYTDGVITVFLNKGANLDDIYSYNIMFPSTEDFSKKQEFLKKQENNEPTAAKFVYNTEKYRAPKISEFKPIENNSKIFYTMLEDKKGGKNRIFFEIERNENSNSTTCRKISNPLYLEKFNALIDRENSLIFEDHFDFHDEAWMLWKTAKASFCLDFKITPLTSKVSLPSILLALDLKWERNHTTVYQVELHQVDQMTAKTTSGGTKMERLLYIKEIKQSVLDLNFLEEHLAGVKVLI